MFYKLLVLRKSRSLSKNGICSKYGECQFDPLSVNTSSIKHKY
jgi:hypothetical protein